MNLQEEVNFETTFIERMKIERSELQIKIMKLENFINHKYLLDRHPEMDKCSYQTCDNSYLDILHVQLKSMKLYSVALYDRLTVHKKLDET